MSIYSNEGSGCDWEEAKRRWVDRAQRLAGTTIRLQRRDVAICHPDRVDEVKEMMRLVYGPDPDEAV